MALRPRRRGELHKLKRRLTRSPFSAPSPAIRNHGRQRGGYYGSPHQADDDGNHRWPARAPSSRRQQAFPPHVLELPAVVHALRVLRCPDYLRGSGDPHQSTTRRSRGASRDASGPSLRGLPTRWAARSISTAPTSRPRRIGLPGGALIIRCGLPTAAVKVRRTACAHL